ncbi:MAG: histidinol-phosphate transaminase [Candidatus Rokubacteria bacterium]|nr:histidinol-phosphate transaminase [Candidatus Rokubacteria bacterium]
MRRPWRSALDQVTPYEAGPSLEALQAELGLSELVRLSANENSLGPSPRAVAAIRAEAARAHLYPDSDGRALRDALGRLHATGPESMILGNGADELLGLIAWAAFEPGDEVVIPHPAFEPYATVVTLSGATPVQSPLVDYQTDLADMARRVTPRTKALIVCSPHNPAGTIITNAAFRRFVTALGDDPPLLVLDEAYRDFSDDPECADGLALLSQCPTLIVLRTFSKIAGLAGVRIGYAVARAEVIAMLNRVRAPYNVNRLAQVAALAALDDREHWVETRRLVIQERRFLAGELGRLGFAVVPSQANFLLVDVGGRAAALREALLKDGILVRDGTAVGFPGHLRITVGTRAMNARLLQALEHAAPSPHRGEEKR